MANAQLNEIANAFKTTLGRRPTPQEYQEWNISHFDPRWEKRFEILSATPEAAQYRASGVPSNQAGTSPTTMQLGTSGVTENAQTTPQSNTATYTGNTGSNQTYTFPSSFSSPGTSFSFTPSVGGGTTTSSTSASATSSSGGTANYPNIYQQQAVPTSAGLDASLLQDVMNLAKGNPTLEKIIQADSKYIDDLIAQSQGDLEFALRKLDSDHKIALGTDDQARASFFETVADALEARIGQIPYDYEKYTNRELQNFSRSSGRITSDRDLALKRLDEDEVLVKQQMEEDKIKETQLTKETLNQRGMVTGGIADKELQELNSKFTDQKDAIERSLSRERGELNLSADRGMEDLSTTTGRNLEDIKTDARRAGIGAENSLAFGSEAAKRDAEARRKALERQRAQLLSSAPATAMAYDAYKLGYS